MTLHYIDLKRFNRHQPQELGTPFEKWLHLMKFSKAYARIKVNIADLFPGEEELAMALTEHLKLNADAEMRVRLEDRERARIDEILIRNATRKEALAEGKAEGKAEVQKEVAQKLADKGLPHDQIAEIKKLLAAG